MDNRELARIFTDIADLLDIKGENRFRVLSYRRAADTITNLPEQLSDTEIAGLIDAAMTATGASSIKDMGKVMGQLKPRLQGRADMGAVSAMIKSKLG